MKVYLAGPMQGYPEFNFPAFFAAEEKLRSYGHTVFNPAAKDIERHDGVNIAEGNETGSVQEAAAQHGFSLREALKDDLTWICDHAEAIAMLPGWETSKGSRTEHALATALGLEIIYLNEEFLRRAA